MGIYLSPGANASAATAAAQAAARLSTGGAPSTASAAHVERDWLHHASFIVE
jgi:hypothetical protein